MISKNQLMSRVGMPALAAFLALSGAHSALAQVLPSGAILDINNGSASNSASNTANVFQNYTVTFTATTSGNNYLLFAFREDPAYWTFGNVSLTATGSTTNLLTDPNFTQGGAVSTSSGLQAPADWGIVYQTGTTPVAAGLWYGPGQAPNSSYSTSGLGVNEGVSGSWYDGAVGSFDGIYQGIDLTSGDSYTISFTALANNTASTAGGVELGVLAGPCATLTGSASACTPSSSSGFTSLATPAATADAGGPSATGIVASGPNLASDLGTTLTPNFAGGTLQMDQPGGTYGQNFTLDGSGTDAIDQLGNSTTFSGVFSDAVPGTSGSLTITNSGVGGSVTFTGVNTYTGLTTVDTGATLALAGAGSIASSAAVVDNGVLDISATNGGASITSLSGAGAVALGAQTLTLTNANDVFAGAITGSGGVTVAGGGELLSGVNTYTGTTTINAGTGLALVGAGSIANSSDVVDNGTLDISATNAGASITSLSGDGYVTLATQSLTLTNAGGTFSGQIDGSGGVTVAGGAQTLGGASTYTGLTTVNSGATLALAGAGSIANSSGVVDNGVLDISASNAGASITSLSGDGAVALGAQNLALTNANGNFAGSIAGSGGVAVAGGNEVLSGVNTYTGGTLITGGATLGVASDSALGGASGAVTFDNGTLSALGDLTTARPLIIDAGGGTISANSNTVSLSGQVALNGALNLVGPGVVNFSGQVQGTGTLAVSGATLVDDGQIAAQSVNVAANGTLRGTGSIAAATTVAGTLAPGDAGPGTLTFTAPVTMLEGSTSAFYIDGTGTGTGAGSYSRVVVNGAGNTFTAAGALTPILRGIPAPATNTYTPPLGQQFQIVSAAGGVLGSYTSLTQPAGLAAGTRFDAIYSPTALTLVVTPVSYGNLAQNGIRETANEQAVGAALDTVRPTAGVRMTASQAALFDPLYTMSPSQLPAELNRLTPSAYGYALLATRQAWYLGATAIGDQLADRRSGTAGSSVTPLGNGVTMWANGDAQFTNAAGYQSTLSGMTVGIDRALSPDALIGFAVGGGNIGTGVGDSGSANGDSVQLSAYGAVRPGRMFVDWQVDYLHVNQAVTRELGIGGSSAGGSTQMQGGGAQVDAGMHLAVNRWQVEPTVGFTAMSLAAGSVVETTGGAMSQNVGDLNTTSLQSFAGVRVATVLNATSALPVQVHGILGWSHELGDVTARSVATFENVAGSGLISNTTEPVGRDALRVGGSFDMNVTRSVGLYGSYTASVSEGMTAQALTAGVRVRW